jgi:hypothetical protein
MAKQKQSNLSEREKLMLPTAFAVIIIVLYGAFRWKPANKEIVELKTSLTSALQGRDKLQFPNNGHLDATQLQGKLDRLKAELKKAGDELNRVEETLVDANTGAEFQSLKIQISTLAQDSGLTIIETVPYGTGSKGQSGNVFYVDPSRTPDPSATNSAPVIHEFFQTLYARPLQIMTVQSSFAALLRFVHGLDALSWKVNLMSFDIEADYQAHHSIESLGPPKLTSNLLLGF